MGNVDLNDLLVAVPSRGRPGNIARLIDAMGSTCTGDTHLVVGLDEDDPTVEQYLSIDTGSLNVEFDVQTQGLRQVVALTNHLTIPRADSYRFIGHIGDDNVPRTHGWDSRIVETLEQPGIRFTFGDDLYPGREKGTLTIHVFMEAGVVKTLGYFGPPSIKHQYVDVVWEAWGEKAGLQYLDDVVIEHMHYTAGKAPGDESYSTSTGLIPVDLVNFNAYCDDPNGLNADLAKLNAPQYTPEELSQFRHNLNIPHTKPDGTHCSGWND